MMIRKMPKWIAGLTLALVAGAAPLACGGGSGDADMGGAPSDEDGSGGGDTDGSGGRDTDGSGGEDNDGSGGEDNEGGETGSGGTTAADASIDDLITAICEWEFGCCNDGELTFRLGAAADSVEECVEVFSFQYHSSNTVDNPYPASALLGQLGYVVDPDNVTENAAGIGECVAAYQDMGCPEVVEVQTYCEAPTMPGSDVCGLGNLFDPALEEDDECQDVTSLKEGTTNDVECVAGTTCVPAGDPDNTGTVPICVQRGEADAPCTEDADCDYNFYCDSDSGCTEKGDEGDDCTFDDEDTPMPDDEDAGCKAGLKCDPENLICVSNCALNYPCAANSECPEDHVCAPVTIGNDADNWHQCLPTGSTASDACDADDDCVADGYCDAGNCASDITVASDDACDRNAQCEDGSFCFMNPLLPDGTPYAYPTFTCELFIDAGDPCYYPSTDPAISSGCGPDAPYCLDDGGTFACFAELKGEGDSCVNVTGVASECEIGLNCERNAASEYVCSAGGGLDDDCETDPTDPTELDCGVGLTCDLGGSDVCIEQLDAGGDCEDPDAANMPKASLCKNADCVENWDENGPDWICSDAPVPESNGGNDLTCGG